MKGFDEMVGHARSLGCAGEPERGSLGVVKAPLPGRAVCADHPAGGITNRKFAHAIIHFLTIACVLGLAGQAFGKNCPRASPTEFSVASRTRTLDGRLVFHNGVRQWFELKLDKPVCGERSVQLIDIDLKSAALEVLRGCRVRSRGSIDFSPTGYYSLDKFQDVTNIVAVGKCVRHLPFPDYSGFKPDMRVRDYQVTMDLDYTPGDHPIVFHVTSAGKVLRPWQVYASYWLTGGYVLYGLCSKGFVVDRVFGDQAANPSHFDEPRTSNDKATFNPESAAVAGKRDLHLGYTCVRVQ